MLLVSGHWHFYLDIKRTFQDDKWKLLHKENVTKSKRESARIYREDRALHAMHNDSASTRMHAGNGAFVRHFLSSRSMHRQADYHLSRGRFEFVRRR